jgi:hypothetical protein
MQQLQQHCCCPQGSLIWHAEIWLGCKVGWKSAGIAAAPAAAGTKLHLLYCSFALTLQLLQLQRQASALSCESSSICPLLQPAAVAAVAAAMRCAGLLQLMHLQYRLALDLLLTHCMGTAHLQGQLLQLLTPHQQQQLQLGWQVSSQQQVRCC